MSDDEIRVVFETLDLPLVPPPPRAEKQQPIYLFPVSGDSLPVDESPI